MIVTYDHPTHRALILELSTDDGSIVELQVQRNHNVGNEFFDVSLEERDIVKCGFHRLCSAHIHLGSVIVTLSPPDTECSDSGAKGSL